MSQPDVVIFGEVLFDCFETGESVLGGAPFNVAWHLNAFGDKPKFVSRIGQDQQAETILAAMQQWQMDTHFIQHDLEHATGRVDIKVEEGEPHYNIVKDVAYDFIDTVTEILPAKGILYHGSLALRNQVSKKAFETLRAASSLSVFLDVNLRSPWWQQSDIEIGLQQARWAKLNHDELRVLGFEHTDIKDAIMAVQQKFELEQVIITRGESGALVYSEEGQFYSIATPKVTTFVDTVGAGDAFTARYIHGLMHDEAVLDTIDAAQKFAIKVIGLRGAIPSSHDFYL